MQSASVFLRSLALLPLIVVSSWAAQPNIVILYADDLGFGDVGCYGASVIPTPRMDALAASGLRFTDAHSSAPTCTPSRYSLLTGEYAWRTPGTGILDGDAKLIIRPGSVTLPAMLRQAGYGTAIVGKWHLGLGSGSLNFNNEIKPGPRELGFDYYFGPAATGDRVPSVYIENRHVYQLRHPGDPGYVTNPGPIVVSYTTPVGNLPTQEAIGTEVAALNASPLLRPLSPYTAGDRTTYQGNAQHSKTIINGIARIGYMSGGENAIWDDDAMAFQFVDKAAAFITSQVASNKPFFLIYSAHDPHVPRTPHPQFQGASGHGIRGDAICQFDWQVGKIVDRLADPNGDGNTNDSVLANTLLIVTSDNGPVLNDGYYDGAALNPGNHDINGPYKSGKYSENEGGHRVPFIVSWPGVVPAGQVSGALVSQTDLLASFAALTGQPLPMDAGPDSQNILPALLGQSPQGRTHLVNQNNSNPKAIRQGTLKYHFDNHQFYNLATDPGEANNILVANATVAAQMKAVYDGIAATPMITPYAGWWPLDATNGTTLRDLSGANHPGNLVGGPAWMTDAGKPFLRFNGGSQSAMITGLPSAGGSFSALLWARSPTVTWGSNSCLLVREGQFALETVAGTRQIAFVVYSAANVAQRFTFDLATVPGFDLTAWHHYAVTHDTASGNSILYVDGQERRRATNATGATGVGAALRLAASPSAAAHLACDVSDVRLHARPLTPARISNAASGRLLDQDQDGLLDDWEMLHRLRLFDATDADEDPDGDGVSNRDEFLAGTSPRQNNVAMAGRWDFEEGTGLTATDGSGNSRDGNLINGPVWATGPGRIFLSFDGTNDYVEVPSFPDLTSSVTVACWARSRSANWNAAGSLVSRRGQWILHPWLNPVGTNRLSFMVVRADTSAEVHAQFDLATLPGFDIREWHHYAGTYDATTGTIKLYVDGIPRATNTIPPVALKTTSNPLRIGSDSHTSARFFGGDIDGVQVHQRAMSLVEIERLITGFDDDADGLPDEFERRIINASTADALRTLADVRPGDDFDGDGFTNAQEFIAGTDPLAASDYFNISDFHFAQEGASSSFMVRILARAGRIYNLRESTTLQSPWLVVQTAGPLAEDQFIELVQPDLPGSRGFYRVEASLAAQN
ncbi:MAG: sulfatase-like hydrolase/transferase [Limisphaerales bacterium]